MTKKSIVLALSDEELVKLYRIILDGDKDGALRFLEEYLKDRVWKVMEGFGHCKPWFECSGR
ncbi:MAG: hypothetical protein E3J65_02650 [Dehalococcoidia bacterium]|nr:MAG: hypothetical protein E3J65_02650 [Dehalococcoidia bacterium]